MKNKIPIIIFLITSTISYSQIELTHNVGEELINTSMFSCTSSYQYWSRTFTLSDFGITAEEELIIYTGSVGINDATWGAVVNFNIYEIDENFPESFSEGNLIGSSQYTHVWYVFQPEIITIVFDNPIIIPADVERILVEVHKGIHEDYPNSSAVAFISGTEEDNDYSWYKGCNGDSSGEYRKTSELWPSPDSDINFFITVNGEANTILPFSINTQDECYGNEVNFNLTNQSDIVSVEWNFDDIDSGINNTSNNISLSHEFSNPGEYNVIAIVTHADGQEYQIPKTVNILESPTVTPIVELSQCDDDIDGVSLFNLEEVIDEITTNASNETITFHESPEDATSGNSPIPNTTAYPNATPSTDTVWARVVNANDCVRTSQVNLIVSTTQIPLTFATRNFYECDDTIDGDITNGISSFNFSTVTTEIEALFPVGQQLVITYYRNLADALSESNSITDITDYRNIGTPNTQNIYIRVDSLLDNDCLGLGSHITLHVETIPVANPITLDDECDDDGDGLYGFDTSNYESTIIDSQTDVTVFYTDENGVALPSPLPNPFYTATQTITVRVENALSQDTDGACFDETIISFSVDAAAVANPISNQIECDDDTDGFFPFDTSTIEATVLNGQTGMLVSYTDSNGDALPSPLPNPFLTDNETITVRVENPLNTICFDETTFEFIVRERPEFELIDEDVICINNSPTLDITTYNPNDVYTYNWIGPNGFTDIGASTTVSEGGIYTVIATSSFGCDSFPQEININESELATITLDMITIVDDSTNNIVTIDTINLGFGDYEFSLDDEFNNYQDSPIFNNVSAGIHIIYVRDKNNCGTTPIKISVIGFPNFFTPNNDGTNDTWNVQGINNNFYTNSVIHVFDRFGKIIAIIDPTSDGWDGFYNGKELPETDYWFSVQLISNDGSIRERKGHFSLIRR